MARRKLTPELLDVDFIGGGPPPTEEEHAEISAAIRKHREAWEKRMGPTRLAAFRARMRELATRPTGPKTYAEPKADAQLVGEPKAAYKPKRPAGRKRAKKKKGGGGS